MLPILHLNGYKIAGPTVLGRSSDAEIESFLGGQGYDVLFVEGSEPTRGPPVARRGAGDVLRADPRDPARARAIAVRVGRPRWPAHRAANAEGMDGPQGRRRRADRGHVPGAPGAAERGEDECRAPAHARELDAQLPAAGAVRRRRPVGARRRRRWPRPARDGWGRTRTPMAAAGCRSIFRRSATTRSPCAARRRSTPNRPGSSASSCATSSPAPSSTPTSGSSARTKPTRIASATSSRWRTAASWSACCRTTTTCRRTGA